VLSAKAGAAYRSTISHTLKGDADFSGAPAFNPTGRFLDTGVKAGAAKVKLGTHSSRRFLGRYESVTSSG